MGDRANAVVLDSYREPEAVFLYSHWGGYELPEIVREALGSDAGRGRWDDSAYLARIVFDCMVGEDQGEETGFGIATRPPDNEYPFIVLRPSNQRLYEVPGSVGEFDNLDDYPSLSFAEYVAEPERTWENLTSVKAETS